MRSAHRWQFSLTTLFVAVAVVAVTMFAVTRWNPAIFVAMGMALVIIATAVPLRRMLVLAIAAGCFLLSGVASVTQRPKVDLDCRACKINLRNVGGAVFAYHAAHQRFPWTKPVANPRTSWRLEVLPNLQLLDVYERYRHTEPWNSAHNRSLDGYGSFGCSHQLPSMTPVANYVLLEGPGTIASLTMEEFEELTPEQRAEKIVLVEYPASNIHWLEPRDITAAEFQQWFDQFRREEVPGPHAHGVHALFADGRVRLIYRVTGSLDLKRMIYVDPSK